MKKWYQSSTLWFNIGLGIVYSIQGFSNVFPIPSGVLETVGVIGNMLLRFKTNTGITTPLNK